MTVRESLDTILNKVDYTNNQCSPVALIGTAVPEQDFLEANRALQDDSRSAHPVHVQALRLLLDQINFTASACSPFEMVAACLPTQVIDNVRVALLIK